MVAAGGVGSDEATAGAAAPGTGTESTESSVPSGRTVTVLTVPGRRERGGRRRGSGRRRRRRRGAGVAVRRRHDRRVDGRRDGARRIGRGARRRPPSRSTGCSSLLTTLTGAGVAESFISKAPESPGDCTAASLGGATLFGLASAMIMRRRLGPGRNDADFHRDDARRRTAARTVTRLPILKYQDAGRPFGRCDDRLGAIGRIILHLEFVLLGLRQNLLERFLEARAQRGHFGGRGRGLGLGRRRRSGGRERDPGKRHGRSRRGRHRRNESGRRGARQRNRNRRSLLRLRPRRPAQRRVDGIDVVGGKARRLDARRARRPRSRRPFRRAGAPSRSC